MDFSQGELTPEDTSMALENLGSYHLHYLKLQSKCGFFYWKIAGFFFLVSILFLVLKDKDLILNPLSGIVILGLGCLAAFTQNMRLDFEYGEKLIACVDEGVGLEEKYNYSAGILRIFEDNKLLVYRGNLISRFAPMEFVSFATALAGTLLVLKIGAWYAALVALCSVVALSIGSHYLIKRTRKILLEEHR